MPGHGMGIMTNSAHGGKRERKTPVSRLVWRLTLDLIDMSGSTAQPQGSLTYSLPRRQRGDTFDRVVIPGLAVYEMFYIYERTHDTGKNSRGRGSCSWRRGSLLPNALVQDDRKQVHDTRIMHLIPINRSNVFDNRGLFS